MKSYNGWRSWNGWNVGLWISNDEELYNYATSLLRSHRMEDAVSNFMLWNKRTPDGAVYNRLSVRNAFENLA